MELCSENLEPLISVRGLGWARKAARLVRYQEAWLQPWPSCPPAVGDEENTGLAERAARQRLLWFPAHLRALWGCHPSAAVPTQCSRESPLTPPTNISVGSSVSSLPSIEEER